MPIIETFPSSKSDKPTIRTLFYQGITCSQVYISPYYTSEFETTTGEYVYCEGRNNLKPINVLINPYIGCEIRDVDTNPFPSIHSYLNPIKIASYSVSSVANWYHGIHVYNKYKQDTEYGKTHSVKAHAIKISEISVGQETDMESHQEKFEGLIKDYPDDDWMAFGFSRGAATTFNACAKYKYPKLKLVILEACFYSIHDCFYLNKFSPLRKTFTTGLSLFTKYHDDGPSPKDSVAEFPENVPVVFITSEKDWVVPAESTMKLAHALADKGKNDVYLLVLKKSSHPNYVFSDPVDRQMYQEFIHAIYEKYDFTNNNIFDAELAKNGRPLLDECVVRPRYTCNFNMC